MPTGKLTQPYHATVMNLNAVRPMDERELAADRRYAVLLVTLFIVMPIIAGTTCSVLGHTMLGLALAFGLMATGALVGLGKRRRILNDFFAVTDVDGLVELRDASSRAELGALLAEPALAFRGGYGPEAVVFVYNWLRTHHALGPTGHIVAYRLNGETLLRILESSLDADVDLLVVPLDQLEVTRENEADLYRELGMVGGVRLDTLVRAVRERGGSARARNTAASHGQTYANKGQPLR